MAMTVLYVSRSNRRFNNPYDCFNEDWQTYYPDMRIYDLKGNRISDVTECSTEGYIFRVYNDEERKAVMVFLANIEGWLKDYSTRDSIDYIVANESGYIDTLSRKEFYLDWSEQVESDSDVMTDYE